MSAGPERRSWRARATALALVISVTSAGCASTQPRTVTPIDPRLHVGEMGTKTNFELRQIVAQTEPRPASNARASDSAPPRKKKKHISTPIFWAGVALGVIGAGGALAFGTGGLIIENQLTNQLYDSLDPMEERERFTESDYDTLNSRGETFNALAIGSTVIGLVGMIMALSAYGYQYTHCGPLAPKRRKCKEAGYPGHD